MSEIKGTGVFVLPLFDIPSPEANNDLKNR